MAMIGPGFFIVWMAIVIGLVVIPFVFWIVALLEASRAPEAAFGPPWDNKKNAWTIGLAVAVVLPAGTIVAPIIWWTQARGALRAGRQVPAPFWSPRSSYPPQYPPVPPAPPGPPAPPATPQQ